jgi:hypothetical protein
MLFTTSLLYLSSLPTLFYTIDAATTYSFGQNCSQAAIKLAHGTYQLSSNCGPTMFCASNNTCAHKGCRRDEYPLGYKLDHFPPKCSSSTFCPDEEDVCLSLLPVGSPCQLNRDGMYYFQGVADVLLPPCRRNPHSADPLQTNVSHHLMQASSAGLGIIMGLSVSTSSACVCGF